MVSFFSQDIDFKQKNKRIYKKWLAETAQQRGQKLTSLAVIFCSERYILELNRKFLGHNYSTDVIAFDARLPHDWPIKGSPKGIEGDIFISIETVRTNAEIYGVPFAKEMARVMIHGLLHLVGYNDSTPNERACMKQEEDAALAALEKYLN